MLLNFFFIFLLGLSIGSFANVVIFRLPLGISIIKPPSFCIYCKKEIKWIHKLPIISWICLKGRCFFCKFPIPFKYPLIELFFGLIFINNFYFFPFLNLDKDFIYFFNLSVFSSFLIIIGIIDYENLKIPNKIIKNGILINFFFLILASFIDYNYSYIISRISAAIIGFIGLEVLVLIMYFLTNKYAFGGGDSKLFAFIGSFLGLKGLSLTFMISIYSCGIFCIFALLFKKIKKSDKIPFAPFISISAYIVSLLPNIY